jgi:DnaJ domain
MPEHFSYSLCGMCATPYDDGADCPACGSQLPLNVVDGYVVEFPANTVPCPGCGDNHQAVRFRGWSRLVSLLWWSRETRIAAYVCGDCARREAAKAMLFTALFGWLSIPSWFFYGWRSTYHNWRSVWTSPRRPFEWGAISATEFADDVRSAQEDAYAHVEDWILDESPLRHLSEGQQRLVLSAEDPYEALGVDQHASLEDIKSAYRRRCKQAHPDLSADSSRAAEDMIRLNQAWEILRHATMRDAYDWLQANATEAAA